MSENTKWLWKDLTPLELVALRGLGGEQVVVVRPSIVRMLGGDGNAALVLTQMLMWSQSDYAMKNDGWFYLTAQRIHLETGINSDAQKRIRLKLSALGILDTKKVGMPAKNFYRLNLSKTLELIGERMVLEEDKTRRLAPSSERVSPSQEGADASDIVSKRVDIRVNRKIITHGENAKKEEKTVLGDRYDAFLAFIKDTYPRNAAGVGVNDLQVVRAARRIGNVPHNAGEDEIEAAKQKVRTFSKAIRNIRDAVEDGTLDPQYVPGFDKFAGLGITYGEAPKYLSWAERQAPPKKSTLVV